MKKRVLLISYHFPPDSAVGGLRAAKFAKNLPSFGWEPYVLTVKDSYRESFDNERLKDVEGINTFKTIELPTIRSGYLWLKSFISGGKKRPLQKGAPAGHRTGPSVAREKALKKLKRYFISIFVMLPDEKRSWVIPAAIKALREIRRNKIDCIMTSTPPHSSQLIGLLVKKAAKVKWVADFRDPWIQDLHHKPGPSRSALSDRIERWLERMVIKNSDMVIVNTGVFKKLIRESYPDVPAGKFVCIPNGIDTSKFVVQEAGKFDKFTITYTGTIYEGRTPEPLFEAVSRLISGNKINSTDIAIKLVGNCGTIKGIQTSSIVKSWGLESVVEISGPVPYPEALSIMQRSHLLLLLAPKQPLAVPAKVYDYLGAGTKILAVTEEGATAELIRSTNCGKCFTDSDIDGIGGYICEVMKDNNGTTPFNKDIERFDVRNLTGQLADELSSICGPDLLKVQVNAIK